MNILKINLPPRIVFMSTQFFNLFKENNIPDDKENISVLFCVTADGQFLLSLIIFKTSVVQSLWVSAITYPGTLYG